MKSNPYTAAFSKVGGTAAGTVTGLGYSWASNQVGDLTGKNVGNHFISNPVGKYLGQKLMNLYVQIVNRNRNTNYLILVIY
ncbi:MAG: hypothetical protein PF518_16850 [Spirochaetaceae bacterium]|jgi:hypothetical protein|nr:hypothetical protein [Spirochaetaceae bacterium]